MTQDELMEKLNQMKISVASALSTATHATAETIDKYLQKQDLKKAYQKLGEATYKYFMGEVKDTDEIAPILVEIQKLLEKVQ